MPKIERDLKIVNKLGLHARAAIQLVQLTQQFDAEVTVCNQQKQAPANSVMGLLMLETAQGQAIRVMAEGPEAEAALNAVEQLVAARFNESE
ncbi:MULTISPECIES: HPr family phosphocarrier protein [Oceanimonas]|uniref:HPr family phosphocarrier protein n=1 Tax=Oceanimonas smirnovii TaxID=264574 RepID=A0ABW7P1R8_9GAMM|nr:MULTISPECIES: HPr family phosphocarrier protein [Oceanimonas]MDV2857978.1 HPr family phosphocarrier protein [Oceanimonas sp. CAM02]